MKWLPLESDPDLLNTYTSDINNGFNGQFCDVYGFDDDLLAMVPQPVMALLFLFPVGCRKNQDQSKYTGKCWFSKQTISNACGTVAILHALANTGMASGNVLKYIQDTATSTPLERAKLLETAAFIEKAHKNTAQLGRTEINEDTDLHFVSIIPIDNHIVEFDGRFDAPIDHGTFTNFLKDGTKVIQKIIENSNAKQFNIMALVSTK